jgi:hypothetical protein
MSRVVEYGILREAVTPHNWLNPDTLLSRNVHIHVRSCGPSPSSLRNCGAYGSKIVCLATCALMVGRETQGRIPPRILNMGKVERSAPPIIRRGNVELDKSSKQRPDKSPYETASIICGFVFTLKLSAPRWPVRTIAQRH